MLSEAKETGNRETANRNVLDRKQVKNAAATEAPGRARAGARSSSRPPSLLGGSSTTEAMYDSKSKIGVARDSSTVVNMANTQDTARGRRMRKSFPMRPSAAPDRAG